jgi:hypothetical protein
MHIHVDRLEADAKATRGKLYIDGKFECYTLEDKHRDGEKVHGETRIPAGTYRLELYPHGTRFHPKYLEAYGAEFHKGMLRICDVPGFDGVLIHKGNYHDDTEGCLLLGSSKISGRSNRDKSGNNCIAVGSSEGAYKSFYPKVRDALLRGETVTIEYSNSDVAARNATAVREQEAKSNAGVVAAATGVAGVAVVAGPLRIWSGWTSRVRRRLPRRLLNRQLLLRMWRLRPSQRLLRRKPRRRPSRR